MSSFIWKQPLVSQGIGLRSRIETQTPGSCADRRPEVRLYPQQAPRTGVPASLGDHHSADLLWVSEMEKDNYHENVVIIWFHFIIFVEVITVL